MFRRLNHVLRHCWLSAWLCNNGPLVLHESASSRTPKQHSQASLTLAITSSEVSKDLFLDRPRIFKYL